MEKGKYKILVLADTPLAASGVGTQTKYMITGLLDKFPGKYSFLCLGGAMQHPDYRPQKIAPEKYGDNFIIIPVNGYGDRNTIRQILLNEKPDALFFFTDPRFYIWLWEMEDEVRSVCPMIYWTIWDNDPAPSFNKPLYDSTDHLAAISLKTYGLLDKLDLEKEKFSYIPHGVCDHTFKPLTSEESYKFKQDVFGPHADKKFVAFWNNRNARRKMTGDVVLSFAKFAKKVGKRNVSLMMHTNPDDPEGQNVLSLAREFDVEKELIISNNRVEPEVLNRMYNATDCTINIACFVRGTKVNTRDGYKNIESITSGEEVLTHKGNFKPVLKTFKNKYGKKLFTIKSSNNNPVTSTEEHPFLIIRKEKINFSIYENINKMRELAEWVEAKNINIGDYVLYSEEKLENFIDYKNINVWNFVKDETYNIRSKTHNLYELKENIIYNIFDKDAGFENIKLDENFAYILGEWIADGTTNHMSVSFNKKDIDKANKLKEKYEIVFKREAYIEEVEKCLLVNLRNPGMYSKFISKFCGKYSEGKRIPREILNSSKSVKEAFLSGYFNGDGCLLGTDKRIYRVRTISDGLAQDLKSLLVSLGKCPEVLEEDNSCGYNKNGKIWKIQWIERNKNSNSSCRTWNDGLGIISRIYDIIEEDLEEEIDVFNLEVKEDNSYIVSSGISVHNCNEGFGLSGLESLLSGSPIINCFTGGLQFQVGDWWKNLKDDFTDQDKMTNLARSMYRKNQGEWFGVPVFPVSRSCTGSQQIPFIFDDRVNNDDVADGLVKLYEMGYNKRKEMGLRGRKFAQENFSLEKMIDSWDKLYMSEIEKHKKTKRSHSLVEI